VTFRDRLYINRRCCGLSLFEAVRVTVAETFGLAHYPSQIGQDKWILRKVFPGVTDGYFVEVGAADGVLNSNSKALEDRGWTGICIDPFPSNMAGRRCLVMKEVVSRRTGEVVQFHPLGEMGGIAQTLATHKDAATSAAAVELRTVTLGDLLARAQAPPFIHYLSVDVEGAELDVLHGIPFERYRFGAITIEHNAEEPKRTELLTFLGEHGYRRVRSYKQDDYYLPV
jgi:FkbM family methyltransferase